MNWKKIKGWPRYSISNTGLVRNDNTGLILKPQTNTYGYYHVKLYGLYRRKITAIHRLVAKAFIKNNNKKPEVNHIDGNKKNNNVNNLEWVTVSENAIHAYKNKLRTGPIGERSGSAKLKECDIKQIRILFKSGLNKTELALKFNVTRRNINFIVNRKSWRHIE